MMEALRRRSDLLGLVRRLRRDADADEVLARAAWSVVAEPGDGTAGALIAGLGAVGALTAALADVRRPRAEAAAIDALGGAGGAKLLRVARERWQPRADVESVRAALGTASEIGARLLMPDGPDWPSALDDLGEHAPVLLWVRGDPAHLARRPSVAVVGARAASSYGESVTAELAGDLAAAGALVVSGGAYGIDGVAHRAALGVGGTTVAFLAGGIDRAYPVGHHQLFERIIERGAVAAEVPCGTAPTKWRFLARNRLIAALGGATVVVEAGWRSGSLNTAGHAASLGRPIGAVPGPITSAASAGCHRLLREYDAICVTTAAEVRELWGDHAPAAPDAAVRPDPDTTRLLDALSTRTAVSPYEIARRSGLAVDRVRGLLGMLELDGVTSRRENGWLKEVQTSR
ncbi:DNA-processing protein DprA [Microbacterium sp. CIAB417]|uniref:DNA-processing protein DprA n=1 Tax=Microbacterium sp. CIAB417 TaxID=2860287 RepID=UPI001FAC3C08|nr:DNA-processing protein DprA [Microbacterium sp. CIAB417]